MIARHPTLATYDALSTSELALLIRQGGALPANAERREARMAEARALIRAEDVPGRAPVRGERGYREARDRERAREIRDLYEGQTESRGRKDER